MKKHWKKIHKECIKIIDLRIDLWLMKKLNLKDKVSAFLPEEERTFSWDARKKLLLDMDGFDHEMIRRMIEDVDHYDEVIKELLNLKKEIVKLGE